MHELMQQAIQRCELNLEGLCVLTEAATGPYAATASLAALAGARVLAFARDSRYATREEAIAQTAALARDAGVANRIDFPSELNATVLRQADIVTNSGHLRPLDAKNIAQLKRTAAIPLMFEAWEFREGDVDLHAATVSNRPVAGTNERHPAIDVFSFLGRMAVLQLTEAGIAVRGSHILVLCDNEFEPYIVDGLNAAGANLNASPLPYDAILVALTPHSGFSLDEVKVRDLARSSEGALLVQFWGDIDRPAAVAAGFRLWPEIEPVRGHMGILPSALGPEPIVRLQCGGLKVGETMARAQLSFDNPNFDAAVQAAIDSGFGQRI